jgi:protein-tyrosine phosphatase/membrane-associated phospholipid phosphatase
MHRKAFKISVFLSLLFFLVYGGTNWLAAGRPNVGSFYFAWERHIPFVPWTIIPYMSIDLFFIAAPFLCRNDRELRTLTRRITAAIAIAGACFLFFPLRFAFERPPVTGPLGIIFNNFRSLDQPFNQFPSLHIALCIILSLVYVPRTRGALRLFTIAWFILICISTVLTYQHHVIDIFGGFALAALCIYLFQDQPLRLPASYNRLVGGYYIIGAVVSASLAIALRPWGFLILWPAISFGIVAMGYFGWGGGVFRKNNGRVQSMARLILCPSLIGQHISWFHYRRQCAPWHTLTNRVWIGRRLSNAEAQNAINAGVSAVLDLTAEFSAPPSFLRIKYLQLPMMDLTAPTAEQLNTAIEFIEHQSAIGIVYVHCKVGYSRTAAVAGAYLLASGRAANVDDAITMLRQARPTIIIRPEALDSLVTFHARGSPRTSDQPSKPQYETASPLQFNQGHAGASV